MLSRALKMAFWVAYDHLGKLIVANVIWAVMVGVPGMLGATALMTGEPGVAFVLGVPLLVLALGVALPVATAGLAYMVKGLIDTRDGSVTDLFRGMRLYAWRSIGIGFLYLFGVTSLTVSVWFYATKLRESVPFLGYAISALAVWCLALACLTALFVMPALVQKKGRVLETVKLAAMLVFDNPLFSIGLALQVLGWIVLAVVPPVLLCVSGSVAVVLVSSAYEMLARKYAAIQRSKAGEDDGEKPQSVRYRGGRLEYDDSRDDYLNRGFRDFLFPWKG